LAGGRGLSTEVGAGGSLARRVEAEGRGQVRVARDDADDLKNRLVEELTPLPPEHVVYNA